MGFDSVARIYHALERATFRGALQRARTAHLEEFIRADEVLLLGDGDGRFLEALMVAAAKREVYPGRILSVDASGRMLNLARERIAGLPGAERVEFRRASVLDFTPPADFRPMVIGAHFFLDCFSEEELPGVLQRIGAWLGPSGILVVSDFSIPEKGVIWRSISRLMLWGMVRFFRLLAGISAPGLPVLRSALPIEGWGLTRGGSKRWWGGFLFSEVWEKRGERS